MDDYEEMPIEEFGMALMRGMGWKDGEGLGGSRKGIIEPPEIRAQPDGLGLGATPKDKSPPREGPDLAEFSAATMAFALRRHEIPQSPISVPDTNSVARTSKV